MRYFKVDIAALINVDLKLPQAAYQVTNEITRLCYELDDAQVEMARHTIKTEYFTAASNGLATADRAAREVLNYGRRIHPAEFVNRVDACETDDILECSGRLLQDVDVVVSAYGAVYEVCPGRCDRATCNYSNRHCSSRTTTTFAAVPTGTATDPGPVAQEIHNGKIHRHQTAPQVSSQRSTVLSGETYSKNNCPSRAYRVN